MFSGIVQACAPITKIESMPGLSRITLEFTGELAKGLNRGASVSVGGACLTVVDINGYQVSFEVMQETLDRTTLGMTCAGDRINIERSIKFGSEIGGHIVSGHVDGTAKIENIERPENNCIITFRCPPDLIRYIFPKGFIALDGTSLTVVDVERKSNTFTVHFIPETLRVTSFGFRKEGDSVNVEVDRLTMAVVETVRNRS
ncbi:MAG TPA: riboflavin synthase [Nitrospiraceae bacterium]|nr:riboflavin synthase subunit alpha [Candidatus Aenigmarchaeota archaeon]HCL82181.1 riboflavin synthase [Nitrospiraceae bacterium]